eukprot:scaffold938_cov334-Pavlova_lutheri.AAC.52
MLDTQCPPWGGDAPSGWPRRGAFIDRIDEGAARRHAPQRTSTLANGPRQDMCARREGGQVRLNIYPSMATSRSTSEGFQPRVSVGSRG